MTPVRFTLLLLLNAWLFSACNKVEELQEPDVLSVPEEFPELQLENASDSVEVNVLTVNNIRFPVSLQFEKPANGIIIQRPDRNKVYYKANPGFFGSDILRYRICRETACRPGKVLIQVKPVPGVCYPSYAAADTAVFQIVSGPGRRSVSLNPDDYYCPGNNRQILSFSPVLRNVTISDSIRFATTFSRMQKREFLISYINSDQRTGNKTRYARIQMVPSPSFCDQIFDVTDRDYGSPVRLDHDDTLIIDRKSLVAAYVHVCEGDLDQDFFQLETSSNLGRIYIGEGRYKIFYKGFPAPWHPARLIYRFRNIRRIADQGEMRIIIDDKCGT